jgi:hypothetical protein
MHIYQTVAIMLPVPDPEKTKSYFLKYGFRETESYQGFLDCLTDGRFFLLLKKENTGNAELVYFTDNVDILRKQIVDSGLAPLLMENKENGSFSISDPTGLIINFLPAGHQQMPALPGNPVSMFGNFYEVSLETGQYERTVNFWKQLGFKVDFEQPGARFIGLTDGLIKVGIYEKGVCPHVFKSPVLTYFEPKMAVNLKELRKHGMKFVQELKNNDGTVDHGITETPDGQMIFLFTV